MPQLIKAFRKGKTTFFSEKVWKSGSPQRYGWVGEFEDEPRKKIPAEILEFAEIRKRREPEPVQSQVQEPTPPKDEPIVQVAETVAEAAPKPKPKPKRKPAAKKGAKK